MEHSIYCMTFFRGMMDFRQVLGVFTTIQLWREDWDTRFKITQITSAMGITLCTAAWKMHLLLQYKNTLCIGKRKKVLDVFCICFSMQRKRELSLKTQVMQKKNSFFWFGNQAISPFYCSSFIYLSCLQNIFPVE